MYQKFIGDIAELYRGFVSRGSFTQNFAITLSGNIVAQGLGFLFTPFIARIYGPQVYGVFALFVGIANNLAPMATFQFPSGYVRTSDAPEFYRLVKITASWLVIFTLTSLCLVIIFKSEFLLFFNAPDLDPFILILPLYFLLMGLDEILLGWNIRIMEFKQGAFSKIVSTVLSKITTIMLGITIGPTAFGIVIGNLITYPVESLGKLSKSVRVELRHLFAFDSLENLRLTLRKFAAHPLYVTPGLIISNLSNQLPIYFFSMAVSPVATGLYALANSLVSLPLNILINSSTAVFLQKSATVHQASPQQLAQITNSLYRRLFWISLIPLTAFSFLSEWIFVILFGSDWQEAGRYAGILAMGSVFTASSFTLSVIYRLMSREYINFWINLFFVALKFLGLWLGVHENEIMLALAAYSVVTLISHITHLFWIFKIIDLERLGLIAHALITTAIFAVMLYIKLS